MSGRKLLEFHCCSSDVIGSVAPPRLQQDLGAWGRHAGALGESLGHSVAKDSED